MDLTQMSPMGLCSANLGEELKYVQFKSGLVVS